MPSFEFVLGDRYRLLSPLGEGGMASVYLATDERLARRVAVKVLSDSLVRDPEFVQRFQREAESAAKLSHPNIVSVYDVGRDGDTHYIVMELIKGRNLKDIIQDHGGLKVEQTVALGGQVLDGLAFAHDHQLVHRDIKPQNILVTKDGTAKLADFGIAKAADASSATQTALVLGSAHYLSPEQAAGEPVSPQSDLYSMGVVLYEMSTGTLPFDGSNLLAVASQHIHDQPQLASMLNPEIPPALNRVILRALAKDPDERFTSATEMKEALLEVPAPEPAVDPGSTQVSSPLVRHDDERGRSITTRPALIIHAFWAFLVAVVALIVNRGVWYLPASFSHHLSGSTLSILSAVVGALAIVVFIFGLVERVRHRYTIDDQAVTVETGFIGHHRDAIPLPAIVNLQLHQHPLARLLNTGTIVLTTVQTPGQRQVALHLRDVPHASDIYEEILGRLGSGRRRSREPEAMLDEFGP